MRHDRLLVTLFLFTWTFVGAFEEVPNPLYSAFNSRRNTNTECIKQTSCSCKFSDGTVVDLSSIASQDKSNPRFSLQKSKTDSYLYSYNPCNAFEQGDCKQDVAVCQSSTDLKQAYVTGHQSQVSFSVLSPDQLLATYTGDMGRKTFIVWVCQKSGDDRLEVIGEDPAGSIYNMTLHSKCACPDGCLSKQPSNEGLSTGSILVIFFFVILCCYLFGGILFQKIVKGAEGVEVIPNYEFWKDFPLLVRDGVLYVLNGCRTEASYERI